MIQRLPEHTWKMACAKVEVASAVATRREAKVFMMPMFDDANVTAGQSALGPAFIPRPLP